MKTFIGILSFLVFFIPLTGIGVAFAIGLLHSNYPDGYPVAAIVVGILCACGGIFVGAHSARATIKRYEQKHDSRPVA
jgi:hypothetical protein